MPVVLSFEAWRGSCWRMVEAQHKVSTMKLVDSAEEQALLEDLLEGSKPPLPPECHGLHYLLATPFRYGAVYPHGSRFRRAGRTAGVFYGSQEVETALAEVVFYRLLFHRESPATPLPLNPLEFTAFCIGVKSAKALDITQTPEPALKALNDYAACQALADEVRSEGGDLIRYMSARDPLHRANLALLSPSAFAVPSPTGWQSWYIRLGPKGATALCDHPRKGLDFPLAVFSADARMKD